MPLDVARHLDHRRGDADRFVERRDRRRVAGDAHAGGEHLVEVAPDRDRRAQRAVQQQHRQRHDDDDHDHERSEPDRLHHVHHRFS
ncbi:MAG: hypothetical protein AB1832_11225 [Pseudomonadota bacterium]